MMPALATMPLPAALVMKPTTRPNLLLVDDDPVFGKVMQRAAIYFATPLVYAPSVDAFSSLTPSRFDVAIVDYDLGSLTGVELAHYLDRHAALPIVMVSRSARRPDLDWSDSIRIFVHKDKGPAAILDAAFEAHEIASIHRRSRS